MADGYSGGAGRNRTADRGFADLGLTTWRPRPSTPRSAKAALRGGPGYRKTGRARQETLAHGEGGNLERETGFEPATSTLARSHSTTELLPLRPLIITNM